MKAFPPASHLVLTAAVMPGMLHLSFLLQTLFFLDLSFLSSTTASGTDQFVSLQNTLSFDGAANITPDGVLELTNHTVHIKGHAFYPSPWQFRKSPGEVVQSFSVTFVFGMVPIDSDECTDGMTLLISPTKDFSGAQTSQYLGLLNKTSDGNPSNHLFAVELDSSQNDEFNDIDDNHIGININSLTSFQSNSAAFYDEKNGVFTNLSLVSREEMQVWVDYNGETTQINVTLAPLRVAKPSRPLLSAAYNLSTVLEDPSYIGFSASTGPINCLYCVLGWSMSINGPAPLIDITKLPKLPHVGKKHLSNKVLEIILPIATAIFILLVVTIIALLVRRRMKYAEIHEDWEAEFGPHRFSYKDLFHGTDGFKNKNLLGRGGFGKVYKGVLPISKIEVAVKRVSHDSKQGMKEFIAEVVSIGRLRHRNLVQLLGYCRRKGELLLVYDYMPNGSLDKYLHCDEDKSTLDWDQRFQIIKGVASGLLYLHERWEKVVIHRDIKASNVLLDYEMNGRLGDFGLAKLYDHGTDPQTTHVVGTMGYLAPELARTGKATTQTDVYAFGIFILEVTCGQRPINCNAGDSSQILIDWVVENWHKGSLTYTIDHKLQGNYSADEVNLALNLALMCAHPFCNTRPSMHQVIQYLNGEMPLPELMPTNISYSVLGLMQNEGFDQCPSLPSGVHSSGMTCSLSGGR